MIGRVRRYAAALVGLLLAPLTWVATLVPAGVAAIVSGVHVAWGQGPALIVCGALFLLLAAIIGKGMGE